jgi:hypothetical protein
MWPTAFWSENVGWMEVPTAFCGKFDHNSSVLVESGHEILRDQCVILQPMDECGQLHHGVEM